MAAREIRPPVMFIPAGGELYGETGDGPTFIDYSPHPVPADQPHPLDEPVGEADPKEPTTDTSKSDEPED